MARAGGAVCQSDDAHGHHCSCVGARARGGADDVVIGLLAPPGAGTNGIPLQQTFNFERVFVPAGKTVYVWLGLTARDLTQVNAAGVRLAHTGEYTVRFGVKSGHHVEVPLTVTEA